VGLHYPPVASNDFEVILAIQDANLTEAERREGSLSAAFTREHLAQMAREALVRVAEDAGVAFVAKDNARSLGAHADGLRMTMVGNFTFNGKPTGSWRFRCRPRAASRPEPGFATWARGGSGATLTRLCP
jgi:hypothetical protein